MTTSEPTTGEIVRALRCVAEDAECKDCRYKYPVGNVILCDHEQMNGNAADRLESQERTITDKDAKIAELTARAEKAERERDAAIKALTEYEDAIDPTVEDIMRDWTASNCAELTKPIKFPCVTCVHHECGYFGNEPCKSCWGGNEWRGLPQDGEGKK